MNQILQKIKEHAQLCLKYIWRNIASAAVLFLLIVLLAFGLVFWQCYLSREASSSFQAETLQINQQLLNDFSADWQARENQFEQASQKQYLDPFRREAIPEIED